MNTSNLIHDQNNRQVRKVNCPVIQKQMKKRKNKETREIVFKFEKKKPFKKVLNKAAITPSIEDFL